MADGDTERDGGEYLYDALLAHGIDLLVGLPGTQTLPLDRVVGSREGIEYVMARHETAIPHVAWGHYEASGRPAATLTVPGPGETNAMHGLKNALEDCVPIVHITGDIHPDEMGKKPIHEIDPGTYDPVVKENVRVTNAVDLPAAIERGITAALTPPYGPVRLGIPNRIFDSAFSAPTVSVEPERISRDNDSRFDQAADMLGEAERPVVYVGGGVRRSPDGPAAIRALVDELDATVVTSYKGKGVFPEDDPRFMGVTGSSLPPGARAALTHADTVASFGTDFDGVTTAGWQIPFGEQLIHVTLDPDAIDVAYESDLAIIEDAGRAARAIRDRLSGREPPERWDPAKVGKAVRDEYLTYLTNEGAFDDTPEFTTPAVLHTIRENIPRDTVVALDVGGFRLWALQAFEAYQPTEMIAAGSWAGMGVGLPAAIGAKLARPETPVVCLTGDGGLLMCIHELATAVEQELDIVIVVSNNRDFGIISKKSGFRTEGGDHPFAWDPPSFPRIAEGFGCHGEAVDDAAALSAALDSALDRDGPSLIDVDIPTKELTASDSSNFETDLTFD